MPDFLSGGVSQTRVRRVAPADTTVRCALGEAVTRQLTAGIGVFDGIVGGIDALRPGFVGRGLDRQPATDADDGKPTATAISTIPVNGHVHDIAVDGNGEHVYVALSESVTVLSSEHRVVATIPVPRHPKDLLMDAHGKHLIVSQRGGRHRLSIPAPTP